MNECSKRAPAGVMPEENSRRRFPRDQAVALCLRTWPKALQEERKRASVALILRQLGREVYEINDGPCGMRRKRGGSSSRVI